MSLKLKETKKGLPKSLFDAGVIKELELVEFSLVLVPDRDCVLIDVGRCPIPLRKGGSVYLG